MNTIIGSGRFPSYRHPGRVWEAALLSNGEGYCDCPGFVKHGHCRHIDALKPQQSRRKRKVTMSSDSLIKTFLSQTNKPMK